MNHTCIFFRGMILFCPPSFFFRKDCFRGLRFLWCPGFRTTCTHGVEITRDQMARWMTNLGPLILPLKALLHTDLLKNGRLAMDETGLQVLKEKNRRPDQKSFMLVQAREGPPCGLGGAGFTIHLRGIFDLRF